MKTEFQNKRYRTLVMIEFDANDHEAAEHWYEELQRRLDGRSPEDYKLRETLTAALGASLTGNPELFPTLIRQGEKFSGQEIESGVFWDDARIEEVVAAQKP